jgi:hypothetical protein
VPECAVQRIPACDGNTIAANARKRHMRSERSVIGLPKCRQKVDAQLREFAIGQTFRPQEARPARFRSVAEVEKR